MIHAFDRFYCRLDRSRIKSQLDMADSEEKGDRNILASCLEDTRKLIGGKNFVILTGQHAKRLPNRTNVCLVVDNLANHLTRKR